MDKTRAPLTDAIERVLRNRTYDRHAADENIFEELLDDIDAVVRVATARASHQPLDYRVDPRLFGGIADEIARGGR